MKKTYITPTTTIEVASITNMIAESLSKTIPLIDDDETEDPDGWLTKEISGVGSWNIDW